MHKEVLVAIVFGSILGLVVAFGVWRANGAIKEEAQKLTQASDSTSEEKVESTSNNASLTLSKPADHSVALTSPMEVAGVTQSENAVIISTNEVDYFVFAKDSGEFTENIDLSGGLNEIQVFSFDDSGASNYASLLVGYSSEFGAKEDESDDATSEGDIKEKVDQKIAEKTNPPKMYIGTTTDITDTGVQIKEESGTIKQLSLNKDSTTFANIVGTQKTISFSDLAIGDYIIALGYTNGKEILDTRRILVATPFKATSKTAIYGTVKTKATREITLTTNDKEYKIPTNTKGLTVSVIRDGVSMKSTTNTLGEGDIVIIIGTPDGDSFTPRKIYIVKKAS